MFDLKLFRAKHNLTQKDVALLFNCVQGNISNIENNGRDLESYQVDILVNKYGADEINKYLSKSNINIIEKQISKVKHTRPHIPISAIAGKLCEYYATVKESDCERYPLIAGLPDYNFTIPVVGNSMIPEYRSGDIVACKYVEHEDFIQWGKAYIIDTTQGIVFKKVMPIDTDDDSILCVSFNKEEFPCYKLKKEFIYSMAVVVGIARRE